MRKGADTSTPRTEALSKKQEFDTCRPRFFSRPPLHTLTRSPVLASRPLALSPRGYTHTGAAARRPFFFFFVLLSRCRAKSSPCKSASAATRLGPSSGARCVGADGGPGCRGGGHTRRPHRAMHREKKTHRSPPFVLPSTPHTQLCSEHGIGTDGVLQEPDVQVRGREFLVVARRAGAHRRHRRFLPPPTFPHSLPPKTIPFTGRRPQGRLLLPGRR